jgi:hypothetical protein
MEKAMAIVDKKEYHKQWRLKNPDKIKAYVHKHQAKSTQKLKRWRHANPARCLHLNIKSRATRMGTEFNLDWQDIDIPILCPALGIPIMAGTNEGMKTGPSPYSPSVDRIDNTKGYIKGNIQVLSHKANTMKNSASPQQLIRFAYWIMRTYGDKL